MRDVLTIKEAAEIASVTTQAIYQRLKKDLKPYLQYENGRKVLKSDVIKVLNRDDFANSYQENNNHIELLQTALETLAIQLATKDEQLTTLQGEVIKQNDHAREQSDKLIALVEQVNDLQKNNQILLKAEQERKFLPVMKDANEPKPRRRLLGRIFKGAEGDAGNSGE